MAVNQALKFIEIQQLKKIYRTGTEQVDALRDVTLEIPQGDFTAITGPSGSGKSTLLSLLGGLSRPSEGKVFVDEIDVYSLSVEQLADFRREYVGFVFQSFQLIPYLTVLENVLLPLAVVSLSQSEKNRLAFEILEKVGLRPKASRLPQELSGGEQQRVAIARALVNRPPIVLADEPTGNLDTATGDEIMQLLRDLNNEGHTCIMVTHNPLNIQYADRSIRMRDGRLMEEIGQSTPYAC